MLHVPIVASGTAGRDSIDGPCRELSGGELADRLRSLSAMLHESCAPIEGEFVQVGQPLYEAIQSLTRLSATFEQMALDLEQAAVARATVELEQIAEQAQVAARTLVSEREVLGRLVAAVDKVREHTARMRKSVEAIGLISTYVKISAAQVTSDESSFREFTDELGRLRAAASAAVECFADEGDRLAALLTAASARAEEADTRQDGALTSLRDGLAQSLRAVAQQREQAVLTAGQIEVRSSQIRSGIEAVITSLQVGDMLRQRVEHVVHALGAVAQISGPVCSDELSDAGRPLLDAEGQSTVASLACRLQARQLEQSAESLETDLRQVISSLALLAGEATEIQRLGSALYSDTAREGASFLSAIGDDLGKMTILLKSCEAARVEVDRAIEAAVGILGMLNGQFESIRSIEVGVRIAALNATLRSDRLGASGKALAVLAHELRMHGNMIVTYAGDIMGGLAEITAAAEQLAKSRAMGGQATLASLEESIAALIATLGNAGAHVDRHLASLETDAALAARQVEHATNQVGSLDRIQATLRTIAADLATISAIQPLHQACVPDAGLILHSMLFGLYTMESERVAHREILGAPPGDLALIASDSNPVAAEEAASIDDFFF